MNNNSRRNNNNSKRKININTRKIQKKYKKKHKYKLHEGYGNIPMIPQNKIVYHSKSKIIKTIMNEIVPKLKKLSVVKNDNVYPLEVYVIPYTMADNGIYPDLFYNADYISEITGKQKEKFINNPFISIEIYFDINLDLDRKIEKCRIPIWNGNLNRKDKQQIEYVISNILPFNFIWNDSGMFITYKKNKDKYTKRIFENENKKKSMFSKLFYFFQ